MAAIMALNTNAAGPRVHSFLKMDPIAQSKTQITAVLRALLIACVPCYVLLVRNLESQPAAVRLRSKTPDLIDNREVLCARREEDISGKAPVAPVCERKSKAPESGGFPLRARSGERAARARGGKREGPVLRQIDKGCAV